jgi:hypothetical protein
MLFGLAWSKLDQSLGTLFEWQTAGQKLEVITNLPGVGPGSWWHGYAPQLRVLPDQRIALLTPAYYEWSGTFF